MLAAGSCFGEAAESGGRSAGRIWTQRGAVVSVGGRFAGFHGVAGKPWEAGAERFERGKSYAAADFCFGGCGAVGSGRKWRWRRPGPLTCEWGRAAAGGESFGGARFPECKAGADYAAGERNGRAGTLREASA